MCNKICKKWILSDLFLHPLRSYLISCMTCNFLINSILCSHICI